MRPLSLSLAPLPFLVLTPLLSPLPPLSRSPPPLSHLFTSPARPPLARSYLRTRHGASLPLLARALSRTPRPIRIGDVLLLPMQALNARTDAQVGWKMLDWALGRGWAPWMRSGAGAGAEDKWGWGGGVVVHGALPSLPLSLLSLPRARARARSQQQALTRLLLRARRARRIVVEAAHRQGQGLAREGRRTPFSPRPLLGASSLL